jgi:anti-sigma B factor antagonist
VDDLQGDVYFTVTVDADASPAVVRAAGELDAASSREFATAIDEAMGCGTGVALDLGQVTFVDSAGLRVMAVALRRAKEEGLTLGVSAMSDAVRRIFEMTGVSSLLAP